MTKPEENHQTTADDRAELKRQLEQGEITGAEYNQKIIESLNAEENAKTESKQRLSRVRQTSLNQSFLALMASMISFGLAGYIFIEKHIHEREYESGGAALIVFYLPIVFNVFLVAALSDSMTIGTKEISPNFHKKILRKKIIALFLTFFSLILPLS